MNSVHDLGGRMGFGKVAPENMEPVFHEGWEKRALGLTLCAACLGRWTIDQARHSYERVEPAAYLNASYYEIWIRGLDKLLTECGLLSDDELFGRPENEPAALELRSNAIRPEAVDDMLSSGPTEVPMSTQPLFKVGSNVRTRNHHPKGHTRLPWYARGKLGIVESVQGGYAFPDTNAHGQGPQPQWLYTIVFRATELWGEASEPTLTISIDAFEAYLSEA